MAAAAAAGKKKQGAAATPRRAPPKRGQVLRRVFASLFSWLPAPRRRHRSPRGRRGNRVPAGGGHVEPEPDVANNASLMPAHSHSNNHDTTANYPPPADATNNY